MRSVHQLVIAAAVAAWVLGAPGAGAQPNRRGGSSHFDTTFAFNKSGEVQLSLPHGSIRVTGWTRAEARVIVESDAGPVNSSFSSNRIRLDARALSFHGGSMRYDITVPIGVRVIAATTSGDINVSGTRGDVTLTTASGSISASEASGRVEVEVVSGRLALQRIAGTTHISAISGSSTISDVAGDLDLTTINGSVHIDAAELANFRYKALNGSLDFAGTLAPDGRHTLESQSGDMTLRVPADLGATIDFTSFSGRLRSPDFSLTVGPGTIVGRGRMHDRETVTVNGGGAHISINSFSGDVTLRRLATSARR